MIEVGRVCVKTAGREAGKRVVVMDILDKNFVLIAGIGVKRRRCNIAHLEPLELKLEVTKGVTDEEVRGLLEAAGR